MEKNTNAAAGTDTHASAVTVLTARDGHMVKSYVLDDTDKLITKPYSNESQFWHARYPVDNLEQLGSLVKRLSEKNNAILIRGVLASKIHTTLRRTDENFPEPEAGCRWLMIDFDNIALPDGTNPTSKEAIEYVIRKLPNEFHNASYYYQFSASAGILQPDGSPKKSGLNVHLFFWLDRSVNGKNLAAYLELHCIETGFYEKVLDRSGQPWIRLGIDPAVLRSSVQPHYVGQPIIGKGVICSLVEAHRQALVTKAKENVTLPALSPTVQMTAGVVRKKLRDAYKLECGHVERKTVARAANGAIMVTDYSRKAEGVSPSTNRVFVQAKPYGDDAGSIILYFQDENSPGSWYVTKVSPHIARRFGDGTELPLKELSDGAHAYVRDTLHWFSEIAQKDGLPLTPDGYLPDINSFAVARNCLIEAPTGSGKTTAFCRFARANPGRVILYAAQTIALVKQMDQDLRQAGVRVVHYRDFSKGDDLTAAVYVTTNESLKKFVTVAIERGVNFILVVDEVHMALDDFMATEAKNRLLEQSIARAERCLFMTATITNLQMSKLLETISRACGALTDTTYTGYRFAPVKANPLVLKPVHSLGMDFIAMLKSCQELKAAGRPIPRTVLIVPTSKMRVFELALEAFGLLDDAHIASRQEHTPKEIEEARVGSRPILIASPMFALGLNFETQPVRFWTYFSHLEVDTSQIIQTLNRANRGTAECEVRLYFGVLDKLPFSIPDSVQERLRIANCLTGEASVQGVIDTHFNIDRPTYNALRGAERKTAKSLDWLIAGDRIQNFRIDHSWEESLVVCGDDHEIYTKFRADANASYDSDVANMAENLAGENQAELLHRLQLLRIESKELHNKEDGRVQRDLERDEHAVLMRLCGIDEPALVKSVKPAKICRLFGELRPFLTAQFDVEKTDTWRVAAAEKTLALIPLLELLKRLWDGEVDGIEFAQHMRRGVREGIKALATSEADLLQNLDKKLRKLDALSEENGKSASKNRRLEIRKEQFAIAQSFLATIGISFRKTEDGKTIDPSAPVVPPWDFESMIFRLRCEAKSIMKLPSAETIKPWEIDELWREAPISMATCEKCVHCRPAWICAIGRPIQLPWEENSATQEYCDAIAPIPVPLAKKMPKETVLRRPKALPELTLLASPGAGEMSPPPPRAFPGLLHTNRPEADLGRPAKLPSLGALSLS